MNTIENIKEQYQQLQSANGSSALTSIEQKAFTAFSNMGIPTVKHEEWKYTRISSLFNKDFQFAPGRLASSFSKSDFDALHLPGFENANEIVFVNGVYNEALSLIRSAAISVITLEEASKNEHSTIVSTHLGHSSQYNKDGIHALNTAFVKEGIFLHVAKGKVTEHPVYIYHVTDARVSNILSQPRTLVYVGEAAQVQLVETFITLGNSESFTNQVMEVVVEQDAVVENYIIQNDAAHSHHVTTTHFRQIGKSVVHTVTITLNGGIVRNNLDMVMEADRCEANLFGLYFLKGTTHVDNHTIVDNVNPNCLSNELYKGIINDQGTAVFNGKIYVRQKAQKTNAFQSNKNILLSDHATVNTKPQLEIFADDVKCSHGCTVGQLDEEGLFYLRSRGISFDKARSLLIHAFAKDVLEHIKPVAIRAYVEQLICERLELN
ncbi:MAG: Fe-S cluster assembly protein SufD [Flavisolibacter sp.]|nr:Fe-S cluster assembly protein SufD [Flavisolibacter sp.]